LSQLYAKALLTANDYLLIYNADSAVDAFSIHAMVKGIQAGSPVIQQSSLFLKNINDILKNRAFLAAGDAIFQSRWTLVREMPRYLIGSGRLRFVPTLLSKNWYAHCVGHGLLIQAAVLDRVGGFPTPSVGLEDSALGFNLRSRGFRLRQYQF